MMGRLERHLDLNAVDTALARMGLAPRQTKAKPTQPRPRPTLVRKRPHKPAADYRAARRNAMKNIKRPDARQAHSL